ncbi:MAG: hypothetical protein ABJA67_17970 [Chthonomonadales bacterium]
MTNNCKMAEQLIELRLIDLLSDEQHSLLNQHLVSCIACATNLQSLDQSMTALKESSDHPGISAAYREKLHARLLDELSDVLIHDDQPTAHQRCLPLIWD